MSLTSSELAEVVAAVKTEVYAETPELLAVGGFFQVAAGQTILADHMNTALVNGVPKFADGAARDAQWPSPPDGAMCYRADLNYLQNYSALITGGGSAWRTFGPIRMGSAQVGSSQVIATNTETRLKISTAYGAANQPGRATWTVNADHVSVPLAGTYMAVGDITWPSAAGGDRRVMVYLSTDNGATYGFAGVVGGSVQLAAVAAGLLRMTVTAIVNAPAAGNRIAIVAHHTASGSLTLPAATSQTASFGLHFMGSD